MEMIMDWKTGLFADPAEQPLDTLVTDGGYCGIFRKIACVGDSLSSGEFEGTNNMGNKTYHDYFDYSWGQYFVRMAGCTVYNFSRGGMTAKEYCESFAQLNDFWSTEKACQAYILALGVNDILNQGQELGTLADIADDWHENKPTFAGYYAQIIQHYKRIEPDAKFFLMTMPRSGEENEREALADAHRELLYALAEKFSNTYVLDLRQYGPVYDEAFRKQFYLGGHLNPAGYLLTGKMVASYIDYIIRHHFTDFKQVGFVGTPFRNTADKD